jgi:tetratricopeptide (TPR) repeat protein
MRSGVLGKLLIAVSVVPLAAGVGLLGRALTKPSRERLAESRKLLQAGRFAEAGARLEPYRRWDPADVESALLMAKVALERKDAQPDVALRHLSHIRPGSPAQAAVAKFFEGKANYLRHRYERSEACWKEALRLDPTVPEAGWALLEMLELEGRDEETHGLGMWLHGVEPDPNDRALLLVRLCRMDYERVAPGSQVQLLERPAQENPGHLPIVLAYGLALVRDSRADDGLAVLEAVLQRHCDDADVWDAWLTALDDAGRNERLVSEFARLPRALLADQRFARHEGRAAQEAHDWKAAAEAFGRAMRRQPYDGVLVYRLRRALQFAGDSAGAERVGRYLAGFQAAFKQAPAACERALAVKRLGEDPPSPSASTSPRSANGWGGSTKPGNGTAWS